MNGKQVFRFATRVLGKALRQAIQQANLTTDDIDLFIPHQANARIIKAAARYVNLPEEKVFVNIERYGNTSAASIPIALCEAFDEGRTKVGDTLAFVAFGAGLTWASAVVKIAERVEPIAVEKSALARWLSLDSLTGSSTSGIARIVAQILSPLVVLGQKFTNFFRG